MKRASDTEAWLAAICEKHDLDFQITQAGRLTHVAVRLDNWHVAVGGDANRDQAIDHAVDHLRANYLAGQPECCLGSHVMPGGELGFQLSGCGDCLGGM